MYFKQFIYKSHCFFSPHPGSELCSADFWQVPSLVNGPFTVHIRLDNHLNPLGSIQPLTRNLAPRLKNLPSQVPISSWVERSDAAWSALLRGTTSSRTGRVLNPGLDLDPNLESCTLLLDSRRWYKYIYIYTHIYIYIYIYIYTYIYIYIVYIIYHNDSCRRHKIFYCALKYTLALHHWSCNMSFMPEMHAP